MTALHQKAEADDVVALARRIGLAGVRPAPDSEKRASNDDPMPIARASDASEIISLARRIGLPGVRPAPATTETSNANSATEPPAAQETPPGVTLPTPVAATHLLQAAGTPPSAAVPSAQPAASDHVIVATVGKATLGRFEACFGPIAEGGEDARWLESRGGVTTTRVFALPAGVDMRSLHDHFAVDPTTRNLVVNVGSFPPGRMRATDFTIAGPGAAKSAGSKMPSRLSRAAAEAFLAIRTGKLAWPPPAEP